jgi:flagellar protein FlaG
MDAQTLSPVNGAHSAPATGVVAPAPAPAPVPAPAGNANATEQDTSQRDPRTLQFQVDKDTQQVVTTIVDSNNKTVVVQIPSEEVLRIAQAIDRMQGFLVKDKA